MRYLVAALALVGLAACSSGGGGSSVQTGLNPQPVAGKFAGTGLDPAYPRPAFTLTDTTGARYDFQRRTHGRATLLFFGYTNCPDICPATMADIGVALRKLPAATQRRVTVVFVTTDVRHDSGPVIARWLRNFSPGTHATFVGLRGSRAQVDGAQASAHIMIAEDGGRTHSTQVLLFGPDDYAHVSFVYNDRTEAAQLAHDLPLVVSGQT